MKNILKILSLIIIMIISQSCETSSVDDELPVADITNPDDGVFDPYEGVDCDDPNSYNADGNNCDGEQVEIVTEPEGQNCVNEGGELLIHVYKQTIYSDWLYLKYKDENNNCTYDENIDIIFNGEYDKATGIQSSTRDHDNFRIIYLETERLEDDYQGYERGAYLPKFFVDSVRNNRFDEGEKILSGIYVGIQTEDGSFDREDEVNCLANENEMKFSSIVENGSHVIFLYVDENNNCAFDQDTDIMFQSSPLTIGLSEYDENNKLVVLYSIERVEDESCSSLGKYVSKYAVDSNDDGEYTEDEVLTVQGQLCVLLNDGTYGN